MRAPGKPPSPGQTLRTQRGPGRILQEATGHVNPVRDRRHGTINGCPTPCFAQHRDVTGQHHAAAGQRLDHRQAEPLGLTGLQDQGGVAVQAGNRSAVQPTKLVDGLPQSKALDECGLRACPWSTHFHQREVGIAICAPRQKLRARRPSVSVVRNCRRAAETCSAVNIPPPQESPLSSLGKGVWGEGVPCRPFPAGQVRRARP